jgi:hypothetical protein
MTNKKTTEAVADIPVMPTKKKETSTEDIPMLSDDRGVKVSSPPPIIGNIDADPDAPEIPDGADVDTGTTEHPVTEEEQSRRDDELDMVERAAWRMHQCVRAAQTILREEFKDSPVLMNMNGPDTDLDGIIMMQPHTYIMANELFKTVSKEAYYLDYEAPDDEPAGDEIEE